MKDPWEAIHRNESARKKVHAALAFAGVGAVGTAALLLFGPRTPLLRTQS